MKRLSIKKSKDFMGEDLYLLMQSEGGEKRIIETSRNKEQLDKRKRFLLKEGGFQGPLPTFMTSPEAGYV